MPKLDNDLREFFERKEEREKVLAKCKFCKFAATPVPNKTGKSYSHTGNLTQHLKCKHPEQHETLIKSKRRSSSAASSSTTLDAFVTVMRATEKCHVDYTIDVSDFKKAVVEAVTLKGLPLSVIEASGIKKVLQPIINKSGVCFNRRGVRSMVINLAENFRTALAKRLKNKLVSSKFDTASRKGCGFFGINVQYIEGNEIVIKTLAVKEMSTRHTAKDLKECILQVIKPPQLLQNALFFSLFLSLSRTR